MNLQEILLCFLCSNFIAMQLYKCLGFRDSPDKSPLPRHSCGQVGCKVQPRVQAALKLLALRLGVGAAEVVVP